MIKISPDKNTLQVVVNDKVISTHKFAAYTGKDNFDIKPACSYCCFDSVGCGGLPCTSDEREDKQNGYFITNS